MSFTPEILLSAVARERCISNLRDLPAFVLTMDAKPKNTASVLVPLCVHNEDVCLLYTLRSSILKNHSGQISFPGGKTDYNESALDTALRETEEEIGVPRDHVDVWGVMSPVQGRNKDIIITPVVGQIKHFDMSKLERNVDEVEEIFTVPIQELCNLNNHAHFEHEKYTLPVYLYGKHKIWGITGLITNTFLQCLLPSDLYNTDFLRKKFTIDELMPSKL